MLKALAYLLIWTSPIWFTALVILLLLGCGSNPPKPESKLTAIIYGPGPGHTQIIEVTKADSALVVTDLDSIWIRFEK